MDATRRVACHEDLFNPVLTMGMQVSCILVLSHVFQLVLKPLGQPGPIAQILAGLVLGPSGLSHIEYIKKIFFQNMAADYYETLALFARIIIMFLFGLEMDVPFLMRNIRPASIIAFGGCIICSIFAAAITPFVYQETAAHGPMIIMALMITVILANTASPIVIRMAAELKFTTSDFGRLAISSSLISDMYCVLIVIVMSRGRVKVGFFLWTLEGFFSLFMVVVVIVVNMYLANWLNRRNRNLKNLKNAELFGILSLVVATALVLETMGFNSIIGCFLMGSMFPRAGRTARTLLPKLSYSVHSFVLPIYFGYTGFQADITNINSLIHFAIVVIVFLLSLGGKISGTLLACRYLKIPLNEGVILALLMNLKGHLDLLALTTGLQNKQVASHNFYGLMMTTIVIQTLIAGPIIAFMVRKEKNYLGYRHKAFELQDPESEIRILACVHNPRPVLTMLGLIAASRGSENIGITPYLMHLIELPEKRKTNLMYHQRENDEHSDDEDYGGNDVVEINDAVDTFTAETRVIIHQVKAVSPFLSMYADVCGRAADIRASIIFLPFHKHQRIDGKMENDKEGIRTINQKVLLHAPCTVGILVDRGLGGTTQSSGSESLRQVALLFFGGADDREVLGYGRRLGMHHHINLTIIRFQLASSKDQNEEINVVHKEEDVLMAISDHETESVADNRALSDFYGRYVQSGQVGFVEKYVENGAEIASSLKDMADMYSLFIVGKGRRGNSPLTTGISDWEECAELGTVGDLLASSDFDSSGSVLVIQQHRPSINDDD
ncbi:cation/H(+) antiporter 1-like [Cornus florida]|uniref:cation/H(+) antiporter 1-like n=1 Tax=Cornus florida TaxID=4283 RepID=UPI0028A17F50|nr:cation/H(+) antiporter 1-like [Cornus florida]